MPPSRKETGIGGEAGSFRSTLWTDVLRAKNINSPDRRAALERLIQNYWKPAYFFVRRQGNSVEESKDLVQGFFTALLEKDYLQSVDRSRGQFRAFLLTALKHYLADERDRKRAQKRGGGRGELSLDFLAAETEFGRVPKEAVVPDLFFERQWALEILALALEALKNEFRQSGRAEEFETLQKFLSPDAPSYQSLSTSLKLPESVLRKRVHRFRRSYRQALLREVGEYTQTQKEAEQELKELFRFLSG